MSTSDVEKELLALAGHVVELAKKAGASAAAGSAWRSREAETEWRDGRLEKVQQATSKGASVALFVDGRYGSVTTSDVREGALAAFVEEGVRSVRALAPDAHRKLPDPSRYAGQAKADLAVYDPALEEPAADVRLARVRELEAAAREGRGAAPITTVTAGFADSSSVSARVASNGFSGTHRATQASASVEVTVKDADGRRPEDWAGETSCRLDGLGPSGPLGAEATRRALERLGARKDRSGTMSVLVEARAARSLLRHLLGPLSGWALQQKQSFLEGRLGQVVASPLLTIDDDPLLAGGLASRLWDREGVAAKRRALVERGVLRTFLLDTYYASKLGKPPTTGGTTNVVVKPGTKGLAELVAGVADGVLVTSFLGGNSNSTTGDFSLGFGGRRIVKGKLDAPVAEMNLSGNHATFWQQLAAVGSDVYLPSTTRSPSLLFQGVSVAGT